ncbi:uncharacterized protein BJ212DRAFT_1570918 [Suillus subaureus]|uniref:PH domain-containing protein n=1 Tax=Suillus subaureus TaxID=48587 RepID=A0A9P7J6M0_9AGAM|nr:uncharacterized protein BJ212DRAFT_1570918 [Suillus subaureus]KAG1805186.1 hypothetical protein BJ212DRAFT_1570918 [Suillus subaureus]
MHHLPPSNASTSLAVSTESTSTAKEKGDTSSIILLPHSRFSAIGGTTKGTERHSLFGGTFATSFGKSRQPPPRISSSLINNESPMDKCSSLNLSQLYSGSKSSSRPLTLDRSLSSTLCNPSRSDSLDEKRKSREKGKTFEKLKGKDADSQTLKEKSPTSQSRGPITFKPGKNIIDRIGTPDHRGWMRKKGDHENAWKVRYFVIKGPHLYILRSDNKTEVKIKSYINIVGYKVIVESVDPGRYGFRIQIVVREWMKVVMKVTIGRDYSTCYFVNIPTIPLTAAYAMNPPRPSSPTARDAARKALRRENPNQLSSRDAHVLMGLPSLNASDAQDSERARLDSFFTQQPISSQPEGRRGMPFANYRSFSTAFSALNPSNVGLIEWANSHLPAALQNYDLTGHLFTGLALLRLSESVLRKSPSPPVPDSAFPSGPDDDKDYFAWTRDTILQLLKVLRAWEDKKMVILRSVGAGRI